MYWSMLKHLETALPYSVYDFWTSSRLVEDEQIFISGCAWSQIWIKLAKGVKVFGAGISPSLVRLKPRTDNIVYLESLKKIFDNHEVVESSSRRIFAWTSVMGDINESHEGCVGRSWPQLQACCLRKHGFQCKQHSLQNSPDPLERNYLNFKGKFDKHWNQLRFVYGSEAEKLCFLLLRKFYDIPPA